MKLIVVTLPGLFTGEAALLTRLFENGLETLHLRKPSATDTDLRNLLRAIPRRYLPRIVLHDGFSLTKDFPLKGIHLNGRNPQPPAGYKGSVSRSCHSVEEVREWKPRCNYVFLSPIFDSISKKGYQSVFPEETLREAAREGVIDSKVMALGGVEYDRIPLLKTLGFGGAALLGDIWQYRGQEDFIPHFLKLEALCDNLK